MSKIKFDDRIQSAMHAFINPETCDRSLATSYPISAVVSLSSETALSAKADKWSRILRELLLFGPGAFCLYFVTLAVMFFYNEGGIGFGGITTIVFGIFITYAGAGDLRNVKNLAVPGTVIAGAVAVSIIGSVFPVPEDWRPHFSYAFCLFPFVLVAAKLVQMRFADKS